ncbi:MAG: PilN domain-containing protein, partial [Planctomycetota bacterium]
FIPEWYKADRVRKRRYAHQYTTIAVIFAIMMVWSFVVGHHVKRASAEVEDIQTAVVKGKERVQQTLNLQSEIAAMEQKTMLLDKITPRTKMTAILGELSYLAQENIILSKLLLTNEPIEALKEKSSVPGAVVQIGDLKQQQNPVIPSAPSRLKVTLTGIAATPADAAALIARLEQAEYFQQVGLVFSRPKKITDMDVTEFEIRVFVADYHIQK